MELHLETVPKDTQAVLNDIKQIDDLRQFYLSGGTALSLLLGHRESEDLDFFIKEKFDPQLLEQKLLQYGALEDVQVDEGTLNLFMSGVKLQFLYYPYRMLEDLISWNGIYLSSVADIACTKLMTISARGSKKDFIDLYIILQKMSLEELFTKLEQKYQNINYNETHILKSLVYFQDAEDQPMPRMHMELGWGMVKEFITEKVKKFRF